jgi:hypothetical protein
MSRPNEAIMMVGRKRTGKSTLTNKIARGMVGPYRRVLIIDVNGSPAYKDIPEIGYDKLARWRSGGIYKFYDPDHERMFDFFTTHYGPQYDERGTKIGNRPFHGFMVFEDCTKYIDPNPSKKVKTFLVDHRMWDADLLFTFHSLALVPPFFWRMTSRIILLKTQDTEGNMRRLSNTIPNYKDVKAAHEQLMRDNNPFAHKVVDTLI